MNTNEIIRKYKEFARNKTNSATDQLILAIARAYKYAESEGEAGYLATRQMFKAFRPVTSKSKLTSNFLNNPFFNLQNEVSRLARFIPEKWEAVMDEEDQAEVKAMAERLQDAPGRHYLYIFVRQDMCFEQQAVQAAHATFVAGARLRAMQLNADTRAPGKFDPESTHFVLIGVPGLETLKQAYSKAVSDGFITFPFFEPDIGNEMTAFTTTLIGQADRHYFREYNLLKMESPNETY